jgi:gliding motility-associated-like protein
MYCLAEGTKQLKPDTSLMSNLFIQDSSNYSCFATESCGPDHKLYIHIAHAGEKVYMGFHATDIYYTLLPGISFKIKLNGATVYYKTVNFINSAQGYIRYNSQAIAGPDILNPNGYRAITFSPSQAGDYSIEFMIQTVPTIHMGIFDITVIDTTVTPFTAIDGRLWSKDWSFDIMAPFLGTMDILSNDSIVTSINYNSMYGILFDVTSTHNGCYPWPYPWESSCLSRFGNHHYAQYKMFINNPDTIEYPTGKLGVFLGDTVNVTRGCDGTFTFKFVVNKMGTIKLNIESNLEPGIQPEDLTIWDTVQPGLNTIFWNGINALGDTVPCGDSVEVTITFINGLTNLALYDIESHPKGFIIQPLRPAGQPIASYWNDTLLANLGGQAQLTGCYYTPPDIGCHSWVGTSSSGLGNNNTINTWWYYASTLDLGRLKVECVPQAPSGIIGQTSLCASSIATYTSDPNPIAGSELLGYEWVLVDAGSGAVLFDSVNIGASVKIHFSAYPPGQKRLKVRGRSAICGVGPFGPGTSGEGILIDPVSTTQITNTLNSFSICSGDTTNITLTASMSGTSYSYTANASSPSTTGYGPGIQNPIDQVLVNSGTYTDTVFYHVVPYLDPCSGDTATFMVVVNHTSVMNFIIAASANPVCTGTVDTFSVTTLIGGPDASYQWRVNGIASGPNLPVFFYTPSNGDTVQCSIVSADFCTPGKIANSQKIIINVMPLVPVEVSIIPPINPVCQGDPVTLMAIPSNGGTLPVYQWLVNSSGAGTDTSVFTFVPGNGDQVICILTSNLQCVINNTASDTLLINVTDPHKVTDTTLCYGIPYFAQGAWQTMGGTYHDTLANPVLCIRFIETHLSYKPSIPVDLGNDTILCGNMITLSVHVPGGTYVWQDGSKDSIYVVTLPGEYSVLVGYDGCVNSDSIKIGECPVLIWFPNAFTPNGDGLNDTFHPIGNGIEKFSMQIFNRWGTMVFETSSPETGWDGTYKGSLCPEETYVFKASYEIIGGEVKQVTGTITLQRGTK